MTPKTHRITLKRGSAALALLTLAACAETVPGAGSTEGGFTALPDSVIAVAAPHQNLNAARLEPDGCFWYRHDGPVETTMIPLRTAGGNPICTRTPDGPI